MSRNLYNREFVINDAIVAAHPHGGTTIVDIDSPSGGEGRVLDIIERQALTIKRLIHPNKIIHRLAELSAELDGIGCVESAFTIMKMADGIAEPDYGSPDDMSYEETPEKLEGAALPATLTETDKYKAVFSQLSREVGDLISLVKGVIHKTRQIDINQSDVETLNSSIRTLEDYVDYAKTFAKQGDLKLYRQYPGSSAKDDVLVIHSPVSMLAQLYTFVSDTLAERLSDIRVGNGFPRFTKPELLNDPDLGPDLAKSVSKVKGFGGYLKGLSTTLGKSGIHTTYKSMVQEPQAKTDGTDLGNIRQAPAGIPDGAVNQPSPSTAPQSAASEDIYVKALQGHLEIAATGKYDQATHKALGDYLFERSEQKDDDGKRAKILLDEYYHNKTADDMTANAKPIYEALTGTWDPLAPEGEVKATPKVRYIDFISPTGGLISGFPIGSLLKEVQKNPYTFITRLAMAGAIEGDDEFANKEDYNRYLESVINHDTYLPQIVRSMQDSLKVAGIPDNLLLVFKEAMDDTIIALRGSLAGADGKGEKIHIMRYLESISHTLAQTLATSPTAVKRYVDKLIALDIVDSTGHISARRGLSQKATIIEQAKFYIKEYNLTGAGKVSVDDGAHKAHTNNINAVQQIAMGVVNEMISGGDPAGVWERSSTSPAIIEKLEAAGYDTSNGNVRFKNYLNQLYKWRVEESRTTKAPEATPAPEPVITAPTNSVSVPVGPANTKGTQVGR